jgi:hypothetical protein
MPNPDPMIGADLMVVSWGMSGGYPGREGTCAKVATC